MNPITLSALVLLTVFAAKGAKAQDLPVPYNHVEYKQSGNSFTWNPLTGKTPSSGAGVVFRGPTGISNAEPKISTMARLPFDKRGDVPASQMAKVTSPFTKAAFGKAIVRGALASTGVGLLVPVGLEIYKYLKDEGYRNIRNENGDLLAERDKINDFDGYEYKFAYMPWNSSKSGACSAWGADYAGKNPDIALVSAVINPPGSVKCAVTTRYTKVGGSFPFGSEYTRQDNLDSRKTTGASSETITENGQQIADRIAQQSGWPTAAARALQSALSTPGVTIDTLPPTVSGPSSIPGTTTSTTTQTSVSPGTTKEVASGTPGAQPATKTTTSTTTNNVTYNNNNVTHNTKTITTTNITNNITNQTETTTDKEETKEEEDKEDESPPTDTDLTKVPELYERKYPDGMVGIWNTKSEEIKQSPLFTLADDLMPTGISGGTCPSWSLDLSFGGSFGDYGAQDVSPPCWIWDVARLIIIASALILARALVFGG